MKGLGAGSSRIRNGNRGRRLPGLSVATGSVIVAADGWHHRADAITSGAAFLGIEDEHALTVRNVGDDDFNRILRSR